MKELIQRITALLYDKKKRKIRNKVGYAVACVVVFITTYALILPAITMEKHVACGIPEHQHSEECYEERLVCGLDEYIPVSDEAGGIDVIAEDDSSGLDVIEDSEPVQGHVHTEACYEKVLVCGMEQHTHSAACYKKQDSSVAENTVDEGPAPQENGSVEGDYIEENESGDELVYEEGAAEDLTDEYLSSGQEDIPASENNGAQDVSEGEDLSSGQEDISAAGNNGAQDVSEGEDLSSGQEDISAAENDDVQDVSDGAAAASGDIRDGSVSGQEETGESLTGPVDAPAENGVQEDGDSQASGDEASGQPVEGTDQSAVDAAPADSGEPSEDQSSEPENSIVYLDDESSDGGQAAGGTDQGTGEDAGTDVGGDTGADSETGTIPGETTADGGQTAGTDASKDGAASENTEGENEVPEQGAEDGSTIQESGAEGQQAQAEDPSQGSVSLADYLTGATAVYYSRTAGNDGEDEWKPVENDTVLMPSDKIRVYLAYQLPGGLLNGTDSRARYMLPEQLWLSGSRVDRINHFENGIASGTEDETEKASLLGAEAVEGTRRPDEQRSGQTEFISAIVNIENVQDAEGRLSGQELVFRFVPYTVEKNSDVFDAEGALSSKGQEVNGYFTIDYMVNEILSGIAADGGASSDQAAEQVREAVIVFASVNTESGQREISAKLKISETAAEADPEEQDSKTAEEDPESAEGENAQADPESEEGENAQTDPESEEGEEAQTDSESEEGEGVQTDPESAEGETAQKDPESADEETEDKDADEENEGGEITADASDGSDSAAEAAGGLSDQLPDMPAQNFEQTIRVKTGGTGSGNAVSDFFKNLFGFFTGNGGADSDDAGEALSSEADLTVHVDADEGTFPAGTTMTVKAVSGRDLNAVSEAISEAVDSETCGFQAVDITFRNAQGEEIEPKKPVRVTFSTDLISEAAQNEKIGQPVIVHVQDDGSAQALSSNAAAEGPARAAEERIAAGTGATVGLEQGSVTFEAGETAESEQTGNNIGEGGTADPDQNGNGSQDGSAVESGQNGDHTGSDVSDDSRQSGDVVEESEPEDKAETQTNEEEEADGITVDADSFSIYAIVYTVDFFWEVNGKTYEFSLPGGGYVPFETLMEILGVADGNPKILTVDGDGVETDGEQTNNTLMLTDIEAGEKTIELVRDVENVTFSNPGLMWVGKADADTTVGALKDQKGLEVQYSADLTEEQISQINSQTVKNGDWILISLQPFSSEETLTVTLNTREVFTVKVTDAAYTVTKITDFNGKTGALVNLNTVNNTPLNNALQSTTHPNNQEHLEAVSITINSGVLTSDVPLTKWTFVKVMGTENQYYISSPEGYLNINSAGVANNHGNVCPISVSSTPQALIVQQKADGRIRIKHKDNNFAVNNESNKTENGYQAYNSGWDDNPGEWFTFYAMEEQQSPHVTIHFVDRNGNPLSGVAYNGSNNQVVKNNDEGDTIGTFTIPYSGNTTNIDLNREFSLTGYTYASTHIAGTIGTKQFTHDGVVIEPGLITGNNNTTLSYYTRTDGNNTFPATEKYNLGEVLHVYDPGEPNTSAVDVEYTAAGNQDIYVILDPVPSGYYSGDDGSTMSPLDVPDPEFNKTLEPNGDGTYTLSLSATGHASSAVLNPKANVLLIVDTSSSMKTQDAGTNNESRIKKTREAVTVLAESLLANNSAAGRDSDTIEMAMITFDGSVNRRQGWTSSKDTFNSAISNYLRGPEDGNSSLHKGTDWEDALDDAFEMAKGMQSSQRDEPVYVIFFTDGEPSQYRYFHRDDDPNKSNAYKYFNAYLNRETSKDEARAIVNAGMHLFSVYAFNKDEHTYGPSYDDAWNGFSIANEDGKGLLHNLTKYAYNTNENLEGKYYYSAANPEDLTKAFENIIRSISQYIGVTDVVLNDGITSLTSVGITVMNGTYTGFKYTISDGTGEQTWAEAPTATYDSKGVHWNLGNTALEDGKTYKVSFVVWPSQDAYDWVADLNNGIRKWSHVEEAGLQDHFIKIEDSSTPSGYRYEVATNPRSYNDDGTIRNNLITYKKTHIETLKALPDGVTLNNPEVVEDNKTGTKTTTTYTQNTDGTYTKTVVKEAKTAFGPPDKNMNLLDTAFKIQKKWVVDRPEELVYYLFNTYNGNVSENNKNIDFKIKKQDKEYTTVKLGWKSGENNTNAVFDWVGETQTIEVYERNYTVGSVWEEPLDIAVGLMLTPDKAAERGIDVNDHKYIPVYAENDTSRSHILYYVLEIGHDYTIDEPALDYRFDFHADVYHPMLDNGVLKDVKIDYDNTGEREIGVLKYITPEGQKLSALRGENILRGELTLEKLVVGEDGELDTSDAAKSRIFPITVTLNNSSAPFYNIEGNSAEQNIPWYGVKINGQGSTLYYHKLDENGAFSYYCDEYEACIDGHYDKGLKEGYRGNVMTGSDDCKTAAAILYVSPQDIWTITNIPGNSSYTITESQIPGYIFVKAEEKGTNNVITPPGNVAVQSPTITGTVLANHTTSVEFTNKKWYTPIQVEIIKVDVNDLNAENPQTLPGATFELEKYTSLDTMSKDTSWGTDGTGTVMMADTDRTGRFVFEDLPEGYYKIVERVFPDGYIKTDETPIIEIRINNETGKLQVYLLKKGEDNTYTDASENTDGVVRVENTEEKSILTFGNTPGAVLPNTGGPGTRIFMVLGGLFLGLGGLLFMKRQRLI